MRYAMWLGFAVFAALPSTVAAQPKQLSSSPTAPVSRQTAMYEDIEIMGRILGRDLRRTSKLRALLAMARGNTLLLGLPMAIRCLWAC